MGKPMLSIMYILPHLLVGNLKGQQLRKMNTGAKWMHWIAYLI